MHDKRINGVQVKPKWKFIRWKMIVMEHSQKMQCLLCTGNSHKHRTHVEQPEVIESEAYLHNRKHIHSNTVDQINGHTNISLMKFTKFVRTNTCFFLNTLFMCSFVCNSTVYSLPSRNFTVFTRVFRFSGSRLYTHIWFWWKCAVDWLLSAISA